ncbi:MAG: hypothetical protein ACT4N4_02475 [Rhodospirillales bacterium]
MPPFTTAMVLICALSTPQQNCTRETALHYTEIPFTCSIDDPKFRPSPILAAADSDPIRPPTYYIKTACAAPPK